MNTTGCAGTAQKKKGLIEVLGETKSKVVVPVVWLVPVPVRRAHVPRSVVPGTATDHALGASRPAPLWKIVCEKIARRNPSVSA
jgi:hypothetical protein